MKTISRLSWLALLTALASPAAWLTVNDRALLGASDRLAWGTAAGNYELLASTFVSASVGGAPVEVSQAGAAFFRVDQSSGWYGNFAPGEELLWNYFGGAVTLDFGPAGMTALGFQIQPDLYGAYNAQLEVFDAAGQLLGVSSGTGSSTSLGDGSALFLGILGDSTFHRARILLTSGDSPHSFAINALDFRMGVTPTPPLAPISTSSLYLTVPIEASVPEPGTFALAALALACLTGCRRRS